MAYVPLDTSLPNGATQAGPAVLVSVRDNQKAIRDGVVMGSIAGWDRAYTRSSGKVSQILHSKGAERIKEAITRTSGKVTSIVVSYSTNSGTNYDSVGTITINRDGSNKVISEVWS